MLRGRGIDAILLRRSVRTGFKAGALAAGLARSACEFVAVFDVDYLPPPSFLRACMRPLLLDPRLGLVQARCDFINAAENKLTAAQQRLLDAHFAVEQATRSWLGLLLPFNGTCGIWRRVAIEEAGGWQGDTLAEDMDLSYRMQSLGWRGRYLVTVTVPGELPNSLATWRTQQFRWAKGFAQASRKLLPIVWRSRLPLRTKAATIIHLGSSAMGSLICAGLIALPVDMMLGPGLTPLASVLLGLAVAESLLGGVAQVVLGQRLARGGDAIAELGKLPSVAWFCLRVAFSNARGILEAFIGHSTDFVRTPKRAGKGSAIAAGRYDR
jgi:cellulose synthase/poly-beta-1,6-N-acetylglucosamine synthase-like glycosyltransferase